MYKIKLQQIKDFLRPYKHQPKQGSEAWKEMRGIGGSELNQLLKDEKRLVGQKVGLIKNMGDNILSCNWGSVFETTLRNVVSMVLQTPIFEATSIPSAEVQGKTYSMDGMGVVRYFCDEVDGKPYNFFMYLNTLFEFKCPWSREIIQGEIYADYIPQVLSGMCDLALPEIAMYIEGVFRICRHEELANTPYVEDWLHVSTNQKSWLRESGNPHRQLPMCYGFLGFYMEDAILPDDPDSNIIVDWIQHGNMDFAKLESQGAINKLFKYVRKEVIKTWGSGIVFQPKEWGRCSWFEAQRIPIKARYVDMDLEAVAFHRWCADRDFLPLGTMGWKLLDLNAVPIEKEVGYTKKYEPQIRAALEKIKLLKAIEDPGLRMIEYNRMYGIEEELTGVQEDNSSALDDLIL
jgi:hypothetical protein